MTATYTPAIGAGQDPTDAFLIAVATATGYPPKKGAGREWVMRCPAHEDQHPSLSVSTSSEGAVLAFCHAGCSTEAVVAAVGFTMAALYPDKDDDDFVSLRPVAPEPVRRAAVTRKQQAVYNYVDLDGTIIYQVRRTDLPGGTKKVRPYRPVRDGWVEGLEGVTRRIPYRLPEVVAAVAARAPIFIVEGEKCADALAERGLVATTNVGGAGKWRADWSPMFRGANVVILPDNDDPGRTHAQQVYDLLAPHAATVRVVALPGLPDKGDIFDWLTAGRTVDDLFALVDQTPAGPPGTKPAITAQPRVIDPDEPIYPWPEPEEACFYGIAGRYVREVEPLTESDPMAVLASLYTGFAAMVGPRPRIMVGAAPHQAQLFALIIGQSARARKGTSWSDARQPLVHADGTFYAENVVSGLSTGEGLIHRLRDPRDGDQLGVADKRLLAVEPEFAKVLRVNNREGSTLSGTLRDAWDGSRLQTVTKGDPMTATGYHMGLLGHITLDELRRELTSTEVANGFANRHLMVAARRTKLLSRPRALPEASLYWYAQEFRRAADQARHQVGIVDRSPAAWERWDDVYAEVEGTEIGGIALALAARGSAHILRLALVAALMNQSVTIEVEHLDFAHAFWRYCEGSILHIWGDTLGDPMADQLLRAVRRASDTGLTGREVHKVFSGKADKAKLRLAVDLLVRKGLAQQVEVRTAGRPSTVLVATGIALR